MGCFKIHLLVFFLLFFFELFLKIILNIYVTIKNKFVDIKFIFKILKKQVKNISHFQTDIYFTKYHKTVFKTHELPNKV